MIQGSTHGVKTTVIGINRKGMPKGVLIRFHAGNPLSDPWAERSPRGECKPKDQGA